MITIYTHAGKRIEIVLESELCSPADMGDRVRAFCHIHGSDHQRSLSINKATGWGHCFNAACDATVLVAEWNRPLAKRLLQCNYRGLTAEANPSDISDQQYQQYRPPQGEWRPRLHVVQPMLLPPPRSIPQWQREELHALQALEEPMRRALVYSPRARAYLHKRGIPLRIALSTGVGYLAPTLLNGTEMRRQRGLLRRWADRMVFPLHSPDGRGYIGRSLWRWQPGMNETEHKALLEKPGSPRRWIKTNPSGWFSEDFEDYPQSIILVEGAFDRLTLIAAGFPAAQIVALVGTAAPIDWLPGRVKTVTLALDGDEGGREASARLAEQLEQAGLEVQNCPLSQDQWGKDWNERWQRLGRRSIATILGSFSGAHTA